MVCTTRHKTHEYYYNVQIYRPHFSLVMGLTDPKPASRVAEPRRYLMSAEDIKLVTSRVAALYQRGIQVQISSVGDGEGVMSGWRVELLGARSEVLGRAEGLYMDVTLTGAERDNVSCDVCRRCHGCPARCGCSNSNRYLIIECGNCGRRRY
jgi:hypothetical protein